MLGSGDRPTRLEQAARRAREEDLAGWQALAKEERHAVVLAGVAALPLGSDELAGELRLLAEDGLSADLAEDVLVQMAAYLGYPRAAQVRAVWRRAAGKAAPARADRRRSDAERYSSGISVYAQLNDRALETIEAAFGTIAGQLIRSTFMSFSDVFASSGQPLRLRQLATVSALAVLGTAAPQLRFHFGAALRVGVNTAQLVETVAWVQFLAGMPAAYNALIELKQALAAGADAPPGYA